ncbi:MAG: hypothetical protein AB7V06_08530 [Candidatus Obscuribacterales bacterium]
MACDGMEVFTARLRTNRVSIRGLQVRLSGTALQDPDDARIVQNMASFVVDLDGVGVKTEVFERVSPGQYEATVSDIEIDAESSLRIELVLVL